MERSRGNRAGPGDSTEFQHSSFPNTCMCLPRQGTFPITPWICLEWDGSESPSLSADRTTDRWRKLFSLTPPPTFPRDCSSRLIGGMHKQAEPSHLRPLQEAQSWAVSGSNGGLATNLGCESKSRGGRRPT